MEHKIIECHPETCLMFPLRTKSSISAIVVGSKGRVDDSECRELVQRKDSIKLEEAFQCLWRCDKSSRSILRCDKCSQNRVLRKMPPCRTTHPWNRNDLREAKQSSRVKACYS